MSRNGTAMLFARSSSSSSSSNEAVSPGTNVAAAPDSSDPAAASAASAASQRDDPLSSSSPLSTTTTTFATATTTTITTITSGGGGGMSGPTEKGGWKAGDTEDILPWILCFGVGLIIIWIGWMLRQYINRKCCGGDEQRSESNRNVHWQWISTGNPHSGSLLPRQKPSSNDTKVDLTELDPGGFKILIGGDMTPGSGMTPIASQAMISTEQQGSLSRHDFNHLLGRVCSISDPEVKRQTFELTFDNIQLGSWTVDEWLNFTQKLFAFHPKVNQIFEMQSGYNNKRTVLDEWLRWQTIEKADMRDIYEALEAADKVDVAHNAAISVTLELRQAAGRITSECVDVLSECSEQQNDQELEILEEDDEDDEEEEDDDDDATPTNSVKALSPHRESRGRGGGGSSIGVGVGTESGQGPEERLLTTTARDGLLDSSTTNNSPNRQGSLIESVGNHDTVHSTERLIHV